MKRRNFLAGILGLPALPAALKVGEPIAEIPAADIEMGETISGTAVWLAMSAVSYSRDMDVPNSVAFGEDYDDDEG